MRKTAIQTDIGERTGTGREGETNRESKLRQPHSRDVMEQDPTGFPGTDPSSVCSALAPL